MKTISITLSVLNRQYYRYLNFSFQAWLLQLCYTTSQISTLAKTKVASDWLVVSLMLPTVLCFFYFFTALYLCATVHLVSLFISERQYGHLVRTLVVNNVEYNYFDITAVEPSYGVFLWLLVVLVNGA